jgi:hypothetical protein
MGLITEKTASFLAMTIHVTARNEAVFFFVIKPYHLVAPLANANPHTSLAPAFFSVRAHSVMV